MRLAVPLRGIRSFVRFPRLEDDPLVRERYAFMGLLSKSLQSFPALQLHLHGNFASEDFIARVRFDDRTSPPTFQEISFLKCLHLHTQVPVTALGLRVPVLGTPTRPRLRFAASLHRGLQCHSGIRRAGRTHAPPRVRKRLGSMDRVAIDMDRASWIRICLRCRRSSRSSSPSTP